MLFNPLLTFTILALISEHTYSLFPTPRPHLSLIAAVFSILLTITFASHYFLVFNLTFFVFVLYLYFCTSQPFIFTHSLPLVRSINMGLNFVLLIGKLTFFILRPLLGSNLHSQGRHLSTTDAIAGCNKCSAHSSVLLHKAFSFCQFCLCAVWNEHSMMIMISFGVHSKTTNDFYLESVMNLI